MKQYPIVVFSLALLIAGCSDDQKKVVTASPEPSGTPVKLEKGPPAALMGLPLQDAGRCAVDTVNKELNAEVSTIKRTDGFNIFGWALDETNNVVPSVVVLRLASATDSYYAPLARRSDRDDLVKALGNPEFKNAGFGAVVDIATLPAARYEILIMQKGDKSNLVCSTKRSVNLVD